MNTASILRPMVLALFACALFLYAPIPAHAAEGSDNMITIDQLKQTLRDDGREGDLSRATPEELANLKTGGPLNERVVRIGISTFILNLGLIYTVACISLFVILMFFTPLGLALFRGNLHAFVGGVLKGIRVSPGEDGFGHHLMTEPKKWLVKERSKGVRKAFGLYMHNEFIQKYKNNITAIAFMGTAFLIMSIGLRGIKFMTSHQPDIIIVAILIEMTVLILLGLTTWYEKEEEEDGAGAGQGLPGKQLSLADVETKLEQLKKELEAQVTGQQGLR